MTVSSQGPLAGKTAIVTGANRGIGKAIAQQLALDGAAVVLGARDAALLDDVARDIERSGGRAIACALDLRDVDAPARLVEAANRAFGDVAIVVNNAGATKSGDFLTMPEALWTDGFALKFYSTVRVTRAAWPQLKKQGGSVVNIVGIRSKMPAADYTIGSSVNAALLGLTKALAELGIEDGVQVNAINPGAINTDRTFPALRKAAEAQGITIEEAKVRKVANMKISQLGEPQDIANLVAFIVSPRGRLLQGATIDMDAGFNKTI